MGEDVVDFSWKKRKLLGVDGLGKAGWKGHVPIESSMEHRVYEH